MAPVTSLMKQGFREKTFFFFFVCFLMMGGGGTIFLKGYLDIDYERHYSFMVFDVAAANSIQKRT